MEKVKLFYSYSHKDETLRDKMEITLNRLKRDKLIDEWHDRQIDAGEDLNIEIEKNMNEAHIILLLFSPDFINSNSCDSEVKKSIELKEEKNTKIIPIILRPCTWKDDDRIKYLKALPIDGKPITKWPNEDEAWLDVYEGVKDVVLKITNKLKPHVKDSYSNYLISNSLFKFTLDKIFVYPDVESDEEADEDIVRLFNSDYFCNLEKLKHRYNILKADDQSGKTSLCKMLFLNYIKEEYYPILIMGKEFHQNPNTDRIIKQNFYKQYDTTRKYSTIPFDKKVLIIDDIDDGDFKKGQLKKVIDKLKTEFKYIIITIDKIATLSTEIQENEYHFPDFNSYVIKQFGYKLRDNLIRKRIEIDLERPFDYDNNAHIGKLDKYTKHIESVIRTNLVPSYPIFLLSIYNIFELTTPQDVSKTSYGHCYQAITTMNLGRVGVRAEAIHAYFNLLANFSYTMYTLKKDGINDDEFEIFISEYRKKYHYEDEMLEKLLSAKILIKNSIGYEFGYRYIYYYFVAKYISDNIELDDIKTVIDKLATELHLENSANIIIFITHHTKSNYVLENILLNTMCVFDDWKEAKLNIEETENIAKFIKDIRPKILPSESPKKIRQEQLERADKKNNLKDEHPTENNSESEDNAKSEDKLMIELRKSFRSMEIIGQILRNQYGSFENENKEKLFEEAQNIGLRMLSSFIAFISEEQNILIDFLNSRLNEIITSKKSKEDFTESDIKKISNFIFSFISYKVIYGILQKTVHSIGYDKLIDTADTIALKTNTEASNLINFSIHTWYLKDLNIKNIKEMYSKYSNNKLVQSLMVDIVVQYLYMHKVDYKQKQQLNEILNLSIPGQLSAQKSREKYKSNK